MAVTGFFHHIGTFFLLATTVFLIVVDISAPVVHDIAILKVHLGTTRNEITFGTFGYCTVNDGIGNPDDCSHSTLGYSPADVTNQGVGTTYSDGTNTSTTRLTKAMILHPIATGLAFIAFALSLGAGVFGSLLAALVSAVTFVVTLVALIIDFVLFQTIKSHVNDQSNDGTYAEFAIAIWLIVVAAICSLIGMVIVFFTCCSGRLHKRSARNSKLEAGYTSPPRTTRRRWWSRR